jgi:hypothetical protein
MAASKIRTRANRNLAGGFLRSLNPPFTCDYWASKSPTSFGSSLCARNRQSRGLKPGQKWRILSGFSDGERWIRTFGPPRQGRWFSFELSGPAPSRTRLTVRNVSRSRTGSTLPARPKDFTPQTAEAMAKHDRRGA